MFKHIWQEQNEEVFVDMSAGKDVFALPLASWLDGIVMLVIATDISSQDTVRATMLLSPLAMPTANMSAKKVV